VLARRFTSVSNFSALSPHFRLPAQMAVTPKSRLVVFLDSPIDWTTCLMQWRTTREFWRVFSHRPANAERDAKAHTACSRPIRHAPAYSSRSRKVKITSTRFASAWNAVPSR